MIDKIEYQKEKYIAFVDVLGFSSMVNDFKFNEYYDAKFNLTSQDAFHVVNEYYHKLLLELYLEQKSDLEITVMIYHDAANAKILMRGYLTKGRFVHNQKENLIVGEAYQKAVKGEKETIFPRIEIDNVILDEIQAPYDILIVKDLNDSKYYVNYLIREKFVNMCCK